MSPNSVEGTLFYQTSFDFFAGDSVAWNDEPVHLGTNSTTEERPVEELDEVERWLQIRAEGYGIYCFAKNTPEKNCFRRYIITYQPSLWDKYTVSRQWGRVGSERQLRIDAHFGSPRPAQELVRRLIKRRLKRGYHLASVA